MERKRRGPKPSSSGSPRAPTVLDAVLAAEFVLPGKAARPGELDQRWQAIIRIREFIASDPGDVIAFVLRWGGHEDQDLRMALAKCLLEPLLEHDFEGVVSRLVEPISNSPLFRDMCRMCWCTSGDMADPRRQMRWRCLLPPEPGKAEEADQAVGEKARWWAVG